MSERISEPERYDSAAGWQPPDPYKKLREKARRELESEPDPSSTMLSIRPASKWIVQPKKHPAAELLSSLWRRGEIAVMFGERGAGRSVFAVQIADAIAKGNSPLNSPRFDRPFQRDKNGGPRPPKVLYIDFEMSGRQFSSRYYHAPPGSSRPVKPKFAFDRAVIDPDFELPKAYRRISDFLYHSIRSAMIKRENGVVIVDSIHYLLRVAAGSTGSLNLMKSLRQIATDYKVSILITAPMHPRTRVTRPVTLKDLAAARYVAELADTVFALCRSTLSPAHRYIKHLASRHAPIIHDSENVLAFQLLTGNPAANAAIPASATAAPATAAVAGPSLPACSASETANAAIPATATAAPSTATATSPSLPVSPSPVSSSPSLPASSSPCLPVSSSPSLLVSSSPVSSSPSLPASPTPYLHFLGPTPEVPHITDYAADTERRITREANRLRRLRNPRSVIEIPMSPEYHRYIKGE